MGQVLYLVLLGLIFKRKVFHLNGLGFKVLNRNELARDIFPGISIYWFKFSKAGRTDRQMDVA
jgi:hypothetical protein